MDTVTVTKAKSSKEDLCSTCKQLHKFPHCEDVDNIMTEFGDGVGNDNIIACSGYVCNK